MVKRSRNKSGSCHNYLHLAWVEAIRQSPKNGCHHTSYCKTETNCFPQEKITSRFYVFQDFKVQKTSFRTSTASTARSLAVRPVARTIQNCINVWLPASTGTAVLTTMYWTQKPYASQKVRANFHYYTNTAHNAAPIRPRRIIS